MHFQFDSASLMARLRLAPHVRMDLSCVAQTESTNADLLARAREGRLPDGDTGALAVLIAAEQTAGRGRAGRRWLAEPGAALLMSLGTARRLRAADLGALPLAVGTVAASALRQCSAPVMLKWPNDLLLVRDEPAPPMLMGKLGGVLVETHALAGDRIGIVVGIGINGVLPEGNLSPTGLPPAALAQADGCTRPAIDVAATLIEALADLLAQPDLPGTIHTLLSQRYPALDFARGRAVQMIQDDAPVLDGIADGIDPDGALRVRSAHGLRRFVQGECSLRFGSPA
ncbi:MAG TPA: biotin--[acetyl-CoA-carboxylase] ligase [Burkholderiaceae bacterium]|nr:biotin--[acetyl-CoA-carboxylase] ligase [Burkholderiaceae bacterium]